MACGPWQECGNDGHEWRLGDVCVDCTPHIRVESPWADRAGALHYLSTASRRELRTLTRTAALMLGSGDWWGIHSKNGWVDRPLNAEDSLWHRAATEFALGYDRQRPTMSEAFLWFAADDLATELLYHRGWCPHKRWDKHEADEPNNPIALTGEPDLLLLKCQCFSKASDVYERSTVPSPPEAVELTVRNHPEDGAPRQAHAKRGLIDGNQVPFVGHGVFIRWPVDE